MRIGQARLAPCSSSNSRATSVISFFHATLGRRVTCPRRVCEAIRTAPKKVHHLWGGWSDTQYRIRPGGHRVRLLLASSHAVLWLHRGPVTRHPWGSTATRTGCRPTTTKKKKKNKQRTNQDPPPNGPLLDRRLPPGARCDRAGSRSSNATHAAGLIVSPSGPDAAQARQGAPLERTHSLVSHHWASSRSRWRIEFWYLAEEPRPRSEARSQAEALRLIRERNGADLRQPSRSPSHVLRRSAIPGVIRPPTVPLGGTAAMQIRPPIRRIGRSANIPTCGEGVGRRTRADRPS